MGKLGEILRELKEEKNTSPFKERKTLSKRRLFFLILFAVLFSGSFIGGFYLVNMISSLKIKDKKPYQLSKKFSAEVRTPPQKVIQPSQNKATLPQEDQTHFIQKDKKTLLQKTSTPEEKTLLKSKSAVKKEKVKEKKAFSRVEKKRILEKPKEKVETFSPQGIPILREKGLLENLLFNAEEERKKGNYVSAIRFYEEYLRYREDPEVLNNLGGLYYLNGHFDKAKKTFERALQLNYNPYVELNYLMVLLKKGEKKRACQELHMKNFPPSLEDKVNALKELCK